MLHLPPEWAIQCTFPKRIQGDTYEFDLSISVFGEVLAVENYFLLLPEEARSLLTGSNAPFIARKLRAFQSLLPYYVPFAAMGILKEREWSKLAVAIEKLRKRLAIGDLCRYNKRIQDEWVRKVYSQVKGHQAPVFHHLARLIWDYHRDRARLLSVINKYQEPLAFPILSRMLILFEEDRRLVENLYVSIGAVKIPASRELLVRHLEKEGGSPYYSAILRGLSYFKDDYTRSRLCAFFYNNSANLIENDFNHLIECFKNHPGPETRDLLLDVMCGRRNMAAKIAYSILRDSGMEPRLMASLLHSVIYERTSFSRITVALSVFNEFERKDLALLPTSDELIDLFDWLCSVVPIDEEVNYDNLDSLNNAIAALLRKRRDGITFKRLATYLEHPVSKIRQYTLKHFSYGWEESFEHIVRLLRDNNLNVKKKALDLVELMTQSFGYLACNAIEPLIEIKVTADEYLQVRIMEILCKIVLEGPDPKALPELLSGKDHANHLVRMSVARSLKMFGGEEVLQAVEYLTRDGKHQVRMEARNSEELLKDQSGAYDIRARLRRVPDELLLETFARITLEDEKSKSLAWINFDCVVDRLNDSPRELFLKVMDLIRQIKENSQAVKSIGKTGRRATGE